MKRTITAFLAIMLSALLLTSSAYASGETGPIVTEPTQMTVAISQLATIIDYDTNFQTKYVEEKTGVDIVWQLYPATDAVQKMNLLVASGTKLPDIIAVGKKEDLNVYGANGALLPLNQYIDTLAVNFNARVDQLGLDKEWIINMCKHSDGQLYAMPYLFSNPPDTMGWRQWINTAWLEQLGLDFPHTSEELLGVLRAFRDNDPNGNGVADEIPLIGCKGGWNSNVFYFIQNMFIYYDSNDRYHLVNDGVLDVSYDKDEYREALRFAHMLYEEGLLSPLSFTQTSTEYAAMCSQDTQIVGIGVGGSVSPFSTHRKDYEGVPCIQGPGGAQYATASVMLPGIQSGISVDCENPEIALQLLDAFYMDEEYMRVNRWGEPEVDWTYPAEDEVSAFEGVAPSVKVLSDIWGQEQNSTWANGFIPVIAPSDGSLYSPVWNGDTNTGESKNSRAISKLADYVPDERVAIIVYTDDEYNAWSETRTVLKTYIEECQARFITGDMDIETEWDSYLNELNVMNYKGLLEMDQAAYTRTIGG